MNTNKKLGLGGATFGGSKNLLVNKLVGGRKNIFEIHERELQLHGRPTHSLHSNYGKH